jgi:two-component system OmpR family sensor kinase
MKKLKTEILKKMKSRIAKISAFQLFSFSAFSKSIKWRLQIWHGLILVAVLAGFGVTAYQLERGRQIGRTDSELHRRFDVLAKSLRRPPPGREPPPFEGPPPGRLPGEDLPEENFRPREKFQLPPQAADLFSTNSPNNFYFIIRDRDGNEIARSSNVPQTEAAFNRRFVAANRNFDLTGSAPRPFASENFKDNRVLFQRLPSGETILVGCSVAPEMAELHRTSLKLAGAGGVILIFGLAGGWWIASRAIRPIKDISATATKISAGDLSQRISTTETESELGQLASVLNSTFARLETAFAQQQQFTSDAAHELRTPVSVMLTQTQSALNRERSAAEYRETVEACQRAAQRMRRLIESLLELARLDAGQEQMKRLNFDFAKTVRDCEELVQPLADERGVKIFSKLASANCVGDSERLSQVVTNLLTNAIQHNHPGGEVRVKVEMLEGMAVLAVSDTGSGISPEDLPRVFERFYRADKSRSMGGNGLGLSISKAIVEAHGGTIEVTSENNSGTTFTVRLPINAAA